MTFLLQNDEKLNVNSETANKATNLKTFQKYILYGYEILSNFMVKAQKFL